MNTISCLIEKIIKMLFCLILFQPFLFSQEKIDEYENDSSTISVYFYNPFETIAVEHTEFNTLTDEQKTDIWYEVLHNSVLYIFSVVDNQKSESVLFCLSGDITITNSASFYKLDVKEYDSLLIKNPNQNYDQFKLKKTFAIPNVRGSLFENCLPVEKRKELSGNGIKMYGKFVRVIPFEEIKKYVNEKINKYFSEN